MIKVLMVGNSSSVKGGITTVINQFRNYDFEKYDIKLKFIPTYKDNNNVIKILYFIIAYIRILISIIFYKPDIIHIHMSYKGSFSRAYIIQKLSILFKRKNIIHLHGSEFKKWYDSIADRKKEKVRLLLKNANEFIVLGNQWNDIIKEIEPNTNTIVLNNSVSIPETKAKFKKAKTLLFLGVLIKRKGVHDLIESLRGIEETNYKLLIAGTGSEEMVLKELVNKYNLKNIEFLGWIDTEEKERLLLESQFMILPSYNEGLPMSILESMSYGVPVLSTYVGDIPSVIQNEDNGYLFNSGNIDELRNYLKKIIEMDNENWKNMSTNAVLTIKKFFSEEKYFNHVIKLYKK